MTHSKDRKRATTGTVAIEEVQGKLRIRLPNSLVSSGVLPKGSSRYISTRLDATPENYRKVQRKVFDIYEDIEGGTFDVTLKKYQFTTKPLQLVVKPVNLLDLKELWLTLLCHFRQKKNRNQGESGK